jgi:hypothetical protein
MPVVLLGDPSQHEASAELGADGPWQPSAGGETLHRRYAAMLAAAGLAGGDRYPLIPPEAGAMAELWTGFSETVLGFTPWAATLERAAWQAFLRAEYDDIDLLNAAWRSAYSDFADVPQPTDTPSSAAMNADWTRHARTPRPRRTPQERQQWQAFLRGRHGSIGSLNIQHATHWAAYDLIPLPDRLPGDGPALRDWFQFEAGVLASSGAAHRFTVLLPMPTGPDYDPMEADRRLRVAQRVIDQEKPAHTRYDIRFYWAMFRVGEARLGLDTRIDRDMREQLIPPLVLGRGYLGETRLAPTHAETASRRTVIGRDRLSP